MLRTVVLALPLLFVSPAYAAEPVAPVELIKSVDIPYDMFTLPNGLRVIVHTDRKAPVVAVSIWYHVGSKDEPKGKTGFAHLFEHLMFNGSENSTGDWFEPLRQIGGTDLNGTTWYDRTNYFQTVPTAALERTLFLESDRMGYLLGAVTQEKLDNQIGVVQNEKRQGDNQPFGLLQYYIGTTLSPEGHPYRHSTIGSMADLQAASLEDVKGWFRAKYGPDNAVLVLAGDIDAARAKTLVAKYFGAIPRGPKVDRVAAPVPTLPAPVQTTIKDRVPYTLLSRHWAVEGVNGVDTAALSVGASVLGGLSSSRLDNALVRQEQVAVSVSAGVQAFEQVGAFQVQAVVKPGQDAAAVATRLDALVADFIAKGPTEDEVRRVATQSISGTLSGLEQVGGFGGKAVALAEGLVYSNDPAKYKKDLNEIAAMTPARVKAAMAKWLTRPVAKIDVVPGERDTSPAALAITGDTPVAAAAAPAGATGPTKTARSMPPLDAFPPLDFPTIERAKLKNGIPVYFARRATVPTVRVAVSFDAGSAADPKDGAGLQTLTMALLDEGTTTKNSTQIAEAQERLGAQLSSGGSVDRSSVGLYALSANLAPSLDLLADVIRNPVFDAKEVERLRAQQLAGISAQLSEPAGIANYVLPAKLYGDGHPYGRPFSGTGDAASVARITRDAVVQFRRDWLRPDNAAIYVVGDTTLAEVTALLDARFGTWPSDRMARPVKALTTPIPVPAATKIYFVDRPQSPQSVILMGQVLASTGADDSLITLRRSNEVYGGNFLSRINMDLRETKGWSYGVRSSVGSFEGRVAYTINAPVQADRTGDSVKVLLDQLRDYAGAKGTTLAERDRTVNGSIRELPGQYETSGAVLAAMQQIVTLKRPDDFYEKLGARYTALTPADFDAAMRKAVDPSRFAIVIVGDAKVVRPQLEKLGLPLENVTLPTAR